MTFTKASIILLTCLLAFNRLRAQTDSTLPQPAAKPARVQDTAAPPPVHHLHRPDSARKANDSAMKANDGTRKANDGTPVAHDAKRKAHDSARAASDIADSVRDSAAARLTSVRPDTTHQIAVRLPVAGPYNGPAMLDRWQRVLAGNPDVNFTGQPVSEVFEVHRPNSKDSLFYLIVAILFYFALVRVFFEKYFNNLMTLFFRVSLRQQQIREQVLQTPLPSLLLNILFIISAGLYACFLIHYSTFGAEVSFWVLYLDCMVLLAAIYLVKFVVLKFIGWVFSISRATDIYIFVVFLVNKMMGILLLPFLIVIIFSGQQWREVYITISLAMVFVLWTYRILASYRPLRNEIKLTPFYFFLYLCAFEIAPLLLIYKVLLTYLEKVY